MDARFGPDWLPTSKVRTFETEYNTAKIRRTYDNASKILRGFCSLSITSAPHQKPTTSNDVHTAARVLSKTKAASLRHFSTYVESDIMERHAISVATPAGARLECAANASAL